MSVVKSHPRYESLKTREKIVEGVEKAITSKHGLIAHGRGEAYDYLFKEQTNSFAKKAIDAACCLLLTAENPVISVNGNVCALVSEDIANLEKIIPAKVEVNIFHSSKKREEAMKNHLKDNGVKEVLMPSSDYEIDYIDHNRKFVNPEGIYKADVVFVPLEDGDRCQALEKMGKKVITVDLNPMSRTSKTATVTIVDNIIRVMPLLVERIEEFKRLDKKELNKITDEHNNKELLDEAKKFISERF